MGLAGGFLRGGPDCLTVAGLQRLGLLGENGLLRVAHRARAKLTHARATKLARPDEGI